MYKKILVPVDGSENSTAALEQAAALAVIAGAGVTVMHVLDLPPQVKSLIGDTLKEQIREVGEKIVNSAKEACAARGAACEGKLVWGVPDHEVIMEAQQGRYDLIVIGSRGQGEVKGWLLGSVSRRVVRHARCPVLVVK
ncbi:MAG: universal stress protein [Bacillota bacterium]